MPEIEVSDASVVIYKVGHLESAECRPPKLSLIKRHTPCTLAHNIW